MDHWMSTEESEGWFSKPLPSMSTVAMLTAKVLLYLFFGMYTAWLAWIGGLYFLDYINPETEPLLPNFALGISIGMAVGTFAPAVQCLIASLHSFTKRHYILGVMSLALAIATVFYMVVYMKMVERKLQLYFPAAVWLLSILLMAGEMLFCRKKTHNKRMHQTPDGAGDP
jgi:hypothetical protein